MSITNHGSAFRGLPFSFEGVMENKVVAVIVKDRFGSTERYCQADGYEKYENGELRIMRGGVEVASYRPDGWNSVQNIHEY